MVGTRTCVSACVHHFVCWRGSSRAKLNENPTGLWDWKEGRKEGRIKKIVYCIANGRFCGLLYFVSELLEEENIRREDE